MRYVPFRVLKIYQCSDVTHDASMVNLLCEGINELGGEPEPQEPMSPSKSMSGCFVVSSAKWDKCTY